MLIQQLRKRLQRAIQHILRHDIHTVLHLCQCCINLLIILIELRTALQRTVSPRLLRNQLYQLISRALKAESLHIFQGQKDHRILPKMCRNQRLLPRNIQPIEKGCIRPDLKKVPQHTHVQRLTEPPRTRENTNFPCIFQKLLYKSGLINIVISFRTDFFKVLDSDRQL